MYKQTAILSGLFIFFFIGVIDKLISQTEWYIIDILFTTIASILFGFMVYTFLNKK